MTRRTLVTGFLPFGGYGVNPSALLAESCSRPFELLEVAYEAVDAWLDQVESSFDQLVMLGLRGDGTTFYLEQVARNEIGVTPDVRSVVRGMGPIEADGPAVLVGTLFSDAAGSFPLSPVLGGEGEKADAAPPSFARSDDAGCYLCNYVYYRALRRFPDKRVGFVHVPPLEVVPLVAQRERLARLLDALEAE
jgi:pyroglutamyl-peptidase